MSADRKVTSQASVPEARAWFQSCDAGIACKRLRETREQHRDAQMYADQAWLHLADLSHEVAQVLHKLPREDRTRIEAVLVREWKPGGEMFELTGAPKVGRR